MRLARGQVGGAIRSQRRADKSYQSLHHSVTDRTISTQVLAIKGISTGMLLCPHFNLPLLVLL